MLKIGRSRPWREVLKEFTGKSDISVEPVKEYFKPLIQWLEKYREEKGYEIGWNDATSHGRTVVTQGMKFLTLLVTAVLIVSHELML